MGKLINRIPGSRLYCLVDVIWLLLSLALPHGALTWGGMQCVIVVFTGHTHLLLGQDHYLA